MFLFFLNKIKLQSRFFAYIVGIVLLVVTFVIISLYNFEKKMLLKQAQEKAFSLTRILAYTSLNALLLDDYLVLQMLIDSMMDGRDILSIAILDTSGKVIAASTPELRNQVQDDEIIREALESNTILLHHLPGREGQEIWDTTVPIFQLDEKIGIARLKYGVENLYAGLFRTVAIIGIIAVWASIFLAYRFSRSISRPILQAINLAQEYGNGNLNVGIQLKREDEIGQLIESLNKLSTELKMLIEEKVTNEGLVLIGEFASYIIHDLKNPIAGIHILAEGLYRKTSRDEKLRKYTAEILQASQKMQDFIQKTLDIARWSELKLQSVQINEIIDEALMKISLYNITVTKEYAADLPEIKGDYQMLLMAVTNLLTNAAEAIVHTGEIKIKTFFSGKLFIKITDSGPGIPGERMGTIFRPFFSMKKGGHGLGLAMVKKAVTLHRGEIQVESELNVGTSFTVILPGNL